MNDRDLIDNNLTLKWTIKDTTNLISGLLLKFTQIKLHFLSLINCQWAAHYAWKVFTTPRVNKKSRTNKNKDHFIFDKMSQNSIRGHKIYEYIHNSQGDKNLLVVHGWSSQASDFNSLILSLLDHRFKVVSFDSPAHGLSTGKQTTALEVAQIIQELDKKHGGFDAIISHSFGSIASSLALSQNSEMKAKLITIGAPNKLSSVLHEFQLLLKMNFETQIKFHQYIEKLFNVKIEDFSVEQFMTKINNPTLVIHDEYDRQVPISRALEIAESGDQVQLFKTYGLGHNRILKDNDVKEKILDFIK